jgi:fumarate hydratase class II
LAFDLDAPACRRFAGGVRSEDVLAETIEMVAKDGYRIEHDSMGEVRVPAHALYGAQTQRAAENFPISGLRLQREFLAALGLVKIAAAKANRKLGELPENISEAIEEAAKQVAHGDYDDQFVVDVFQTGSGTSTNMNANEVIAHVAGRSAGAEVHPNDHVNRNQSSNDVIPTAMHIAAICQIRKQLIPALHGLRAGLDEKATAFHDVFKIGRTHLQDAVPMRLGDEFSGYARQVELSIQRVELATGGLFELALGGTAAGTGLNAPKDFSRLAIEWLSGETGFPFREAENHFEAQGAKDAVGFLSGALRACAIALMKVANDIRWLGSGPRCGLGELRIPAVQPGSSMMPGKVNPVIAESVLMVCAQVIGHDACVSWCCASGNFELNLMMPLLAYNLLDSIQLLTSASANFQERCIEGLEADRERAAEYVEKSFANVTGLVPAIGYERAAAIALEAHRSGRTIYRVAQEQCEVSDQELRHLLDPASQVGP